MSGFRGTPDALGPQTSFVQFVSQCLLDVVKKQIDGLVPGEDVGSRWLASEAVQFGGSRGWQGGASANR